MARITIDKIIGQIKKADADIKALNETKKLYREFLYNEQPSYLNLSR